MKQKDAILNGADEIDMVINLGDVKDKHFDKIKGEIALLKSACGDKVLKCYHRNMPVNRRRK